jgi:glycosyltransferase involved in cell wall biosynthesis
MNLLGKKLLVCEEGLLDYKGHFYSWIKAIRSIHMQAGAEVLVATNKQVIPEIKEEFKAIPTYSHNNWSGVYDSQKIWRRYLSVFKHNLNVWRETRLLLDNIGPIDCVLLPAVRIHHLIAWKQLCREGLGKKFKRVILFLLTSEAVYDESFQKYGFKRSSRLIKFVLKNFKDEVANGTVILAGDSHITCKEYEMLSGIKFRVFPSPGTGLQAAEQVSFQKNVKKQFVVSFVILGVSVIDKGIDVLQEAIIRLIDNNPEIQAKFIIQWSTKTIDYKGNLVHISQKLRLAKQVELIETTLDDEEYKNYFHQADFLVLPYRRKVYFNRISGVAVEAACAGIPMIVTENTWLEWAMNEYGAGVTVKDGDAIDLANKIILCIKEKEKKKIEAFDKRTIALQKNSTENYLKCVWD